MNHKAVAQCANGHTFSLGECKSQVKKIFGGTKQCGGNLFEQIYNDGSVLTVSFDDRPFIALRCIKCHTQFDSIECPECGVAVSVSAFKKKGFLSKLG